MGRFSILLSLHSGSLYCAESLQGDPANHCKKQLETERNEIISHNFRAKANLTDVTDPLAPVSLGGNLTLQITLTDTGEPGSSDTIVITLWNGSKLLFCSNWSGSKTIQQPLGGGNLVVH